MKSCRSKSLRTPVPQVCRNGMQSLFRRLESLRRFLMPAVIVWSAAVAFGHDHQTTEVLVTEARRQFQHDRFGLFIRFGLQTVLSEEEAAAGSRAVTPAEYDKQAATFNPVGFSAAEWVSLAKSAGMKSITFTAKHADGFAMWNSRVRDWNVVKRTPFGRDMVRELADECFRQGVKLFLYYSQVDRHHADYLVPGAVGNWNRYLDEMNSQLFELVSHHAWIQGIWLDGCQDRPDLDWRLEWTCAVLDRFEPGLLVGNHHRIGSCTGQDFRIWDGGLEEVFEEEASTSGVMFMHRVVCETLHEGGLPEPGSRIRTARELIRQLVRTAGADANYVLKVVPKADGRIDPESALRLREIGMWMAKNGESIQGTRGGPVLPQPWGAITRRDNKLYIHVLDSRTTSVAFSLASERVRVARYLQDDQDATTRQDETTVTLHLRPERTGEMDRIIVLDTH